MSKGACAAGQAAELVVWGDSVVEQLRGTGLGKTLYTISGAAPFNASLGWLNPLVLAISGMLFASPSAILLLRMLLNMLG